MWIKQFRKILFYSENVMVIADWKWIRFNISYILLPSCNYRPTNWLKLSNLDQTTLISILFIFPFHSSLFPKNIFSFQVVLATVTFLSPASTNPSITLKIEFVCIIKLKSQVAKYFIWQKCTREIKYIKIQQHIQ